MKSSYNQQHVPNIDVMLINRFSTGNVLPKTKSTTMKQSDKQSQNYTPSNQDLNKNNLKILRNNKAIEQIARTQSIEEKKGILKSDGGQKMNSYFGQAKYSSNNAHNYSKEEISAFNATIPIRGSYKDTNGSSLPMIPPKQKSSRTDQMKKSAKKVTINTESPQMSHHQPKENILINSSKTVADKQSITDKRSSVEFDGILSSKTFHENIEQNTDKQHRIDGQIKRYMEKIGLKKRDKFPVFYTLDENGNEVKTSLQNPQMYAKLTHQQQPYLVQQSMNSNSKKQGNILNETKSRKLNRAGFSEEKIVTQNDNLEDIMKICSEFQKTIVNFDKKNQKQAKRNHSDFRKLSNQMKQLDIQNIIIQESDDPALQPYFQNMKQTGRVVEPKIKDLLKS